MDLRETESPGLVCALLHVFVCVCMCVCVSACILRGIEGGWVHSFHYYSRVCDLKNMKSKPLLFKRKIFKPNLREQGSVLGRLCF